VDTEAEYIAIGKENIEDLGLGSKNYTIHHSTCNLHPVIHQTAKD
jgi:hypothetical protein